MKAITLGYRTIADSIYFENQIAQIAKQIVDLDEVIVNGDEEDVGVAIECLETVRKSSTLLSDEEKATLKKAASRIHVRKCSCAVF